MEVVKRLGYVPDATARMFATRRSGFVAALVPSLNNSNFSDTVGGLARRLEASGLQMLLGATGYDRHREEELVATLRRFADIGTSEVHLIPTSSDIAQLDRVAELVAEVAR